MSNVHFDQEETLAAYARNAFEVETVTGDKTGCVTLLTEQPSTTDRIVYLGVPRDLAVFRGHFPGNPLLPGVIQLAWAADLAQQMYTDLGELRQISQVKFKAPVLPGYVLKLELKLQSGKMRFVFESARGTHSQGSMQYRD